MSKSRQELLSWVNELLQTNYTKIEQLGSGAAYCQIMDSIYGDIPLRRVKFNANQPYEYMNNLKILQNSFASHEIDKPLNPGKIMLCKFQDNLDLIQWLRSFWEMEFPGGQYDAVGRRKGQAIDTAGTKSPRPASSAGSTRSSVTNASRAGHARISAATSTPSAMKSTSLRMVEAFVQQVEPEEGSEIDNFVSQIQNILYSEEDTFQEEPEEQSFHQNYEEVNQRISNLRVDEEETF
ncbi:hypothetical protein BB559_005393 [Furculomyces boomerangus]|uniref:Calponin-homology (CH) domain-containing protein n=2 Tax=Harpellales TaxID=61421 RepID=A0A2T9Y8Y0_9FUNG|nr:hypothetical protein BB559_005393 [Furculomyces boomerangus]PVZ98789.1 hypothetical protein BB558_005205 [Smittium angustum]